MLFVIFLVLLSIKTTFGSALDCDFSLSCCGSCVGNCTDRPLYECSLESCTSCQTIRLQLQNLYGSIPSSISLLTNLDVLKLSDNQLTGSIPASISSLETLTWLSASKCDLSGTFPSSVTNMVKLTHLNVASNELFGTLPYTLQQLSELQYLSFSNNRLSGTIPSLLGLDKLTALDLSYNQLQGDISSISTFESGGVLSSISLNNNVLTGTLTNEICPLVQNLEFCELASGSDDDTNTFCCGNVDCMAYLMGDPGDSGCGISSCSSKCSPQASDSSKLGGTWLSLPLMLAFFSCWTSLV